MPPLLSNSMAPLSIWTYLYTIVFLCMYGSQPTCATINLVRETLTCATYVAGSGFGSL